MSNLFRLNSVATSSSSIQNPHAKWTFRRKCRLRWMKALEFEDGITVEALRWRRHLDQPNKILQGKSTLLPPNCARKIWPPSRLTVRAHEICVDIRSCYSSSKTQLFRDNMVSSPLKFANKKLLQPCETASRERLYVRFRWRLFLWSLYINETTLCHSFWTWWRNYWNSSGGGGMQEHEAMRYEWRYMDWW